MAIQLIANLTWETNTRTKFNSNDIVIIMWTNFLEMIDITKGWMAYPVIFLTILTAKDLH